MPTSSADPPQHLKYPPVRINQSLTKLDLDTLMMRSTTRRPEEPGSSLDDSTYELLGESSLETSDDEAHTESIASTDAPTPDDASEFSDNDSEYDMGEKTLQDSTYASHAEASEKLVDVYPKPSGEDSALTEVPAHIDDRESSWKIRLEEEPAVELDVVHGSKVIKSLDDQTSELPQALSHYGCAQVRLVIKATLSQRPIPTPDSYRILYIGMPEKWVEDVITSQIGAALTASPSVSKSVIVRGQIEPYGPIIHVYRCAELHTFAEREKLSHLLILLDDGQQLKFGPGIGSRASGRPDLVVFCRPTILDAADVQELASASEVFGREGIPCIDLAQARPYGNGASTYDSKTLRVCLEGRNESSADYELKEVLPLDHFTFSQLEPSQLNRHLAFISPHLLTTPDTGNFEKARRSLTSNTLGAFEKKLSWAWPLFKTLTTAMLLLTLVPAMFRGAAYAPMLFQKSSNIEVQSSISSQGPVLGSTMISAASTSQTVVPISSVPSVPSAPRDLTLVPRQAKSIKCKLEKKVNIGVFGIQRTGLHQFILSPSKRFTNDCKKPQLQIQVSRESQAVPARYNRTISGEYIVDLEQEYSFGTFNVSIATHSKPLLRQSFEIMLGHNKSTLGQLLVDAKSKFINTQGNLWDASSTAAQHVREGLAELEAAALLWTGDARGSSEQAAKHFRNAKHAVEVQLAIGIELLKQAPGRTWMGLRHATAPVRTSTPMLRARMNALRLRCNMEIATGLSSRDVDEKQSWACSKVRRET